MSLYQHVESRIRDAREALASRLSQTSPGQTPASPNVDAGYPSLSPPLVTLYVSPSRPDQSKEAFRLLEASNTAFRVEPSRDDTIAARFAGRTQHGIEGVERLAEGLKSVQRTFLKSDSEAFNAELERRHQPGVRKKARQELQEYIHIARHDLECILSKVADHTDRQRP